MTRRFDVLVAEEDQSQIWASDTLVDLGSEPSQSTRFRAASRSKSHRGDLSRQVAEPVVRDGPLAVWIERRQQGKSCIVCWDEPIEVARRVEGAASWISKGDRLAAHVVHL